MVIVCLCTVQQHSTMSFIKCQWVWDTRPCLYRGSTIAEAWFLLQRSNENAESAEGNVAEWSVKSCHTGASDDTCADSLVDRPVYKKWTCEWTDDTHTAVLWFFDPEQWFYVVDDPPCGVGSSFSRFQLKWHKMQDNGSWLWYLDEHTYFYTSTGTQSLSC